jgi:adenylate kinase family enzyme
MSRLIIIRGNSGSGKSTIALKLRRAMGYQTMLIPQDVVRRDIVRVADEPGNPAIQLIEDIARYGKSIQYDVIVEGILGKEKYGPMLERLVSIFDLTYAFYFDVSFEETLKRHQYKTDKKHEFGEKEMREWWLENDILDIPNEVLIPGSLTEDETLELIVKVIEKPNKT